MSTLMQTEKLNLLIEIAGLGLGEVDYVADTITLDERAATFFSLPAEKAIYRSALHDRIHPDDRLDIEKQVDCLLSPESEGYISVIHRIINEDGSIRWVNARKQVYFSGTNPDGTPRPVRGLVAIQDITQLKEAEERVRYLMNEMAHRSKNTLGVVQSIARLTARNGDPETFTARFGARLDALSTNNMVLLNKQTSCADIDFLVSSHLTPYRGSDTSRILVSGPKIVIKEKAAQSIGMALHELATNAVKYGALSNDDGQIEINWQVEEGPSAIFQMSWREMNGPPVATPTSTGFGETVIRRMAAADVKGEVTLDYDPKGVKWLLIAPLENILYA
ncbi:MAG: HWE histidine kinase domain-containing protein [Pseudomonadota bacterium]